MPDGLPLPLVCAQWHVPFWLGLLGELIGWQCKLTLCAECGSNRSKAILRLQPESKEARHGHAEENKARGGTLRSYACGDANKSRDLNRCRARVEDAGNHNLRCEASRLGRQP